MAGIQGSSVDFGKALLVPVFVGLLALTLRRLMDGVSDRTAAALIGTLAALAFYSVLAVMYILRGAASQTDRRPYVWGVAVAATFAPFIIPVVAGERTHDGAARLGSAFVALGIALSVWALLHLRTNVSVIPQSRSLATAGPYRYFRHPLYVFEFVSAIGLVLINGGGWAWSVVLALAALQILRAHWEEQLLSAAIPEYAEYRSSTRGFGRTET